MPRFVRLPSKNDLLKNVSGINRENIHKVYSILDNNISLNRDSIRRHFPEAFESIPFSLFPALSISERKMMVINEIIGGYGVERLAHGGESREDINILYINTGDSYSTTLIYDINNPCYYVGSWGDEVDRYEHEIGEHITSPPF